MQLYLIIHMHHFWYVRCDTGVSDLLCSVELSWQVSNHEWWKPLTVYKLMGISSFFDIWGLISVSVVAEHFTCFLVSKGYVEDGCRMNKKKLKDVFKDEYMPLYHVRMKPYLILLSLVRNKYVKRRQKSTSDIVYFNISKVQQIASRHGERGQGSMKNTMI